MEEVVLGKKGTAKKHKIGSKKFEMAGKTGTVQVVRISEAEREDGVVKNEDRPWEKETMPFLLDMLLLPNLNMQYRLSLSMVVVVHQ